VPLLRETRQLMLQSHRLFLEKGIEGLEERRKINGRLAAIKAQVAIGFPLNDAEVQDLQENISAKILAIHAIEQKAIAALQGAMA
jgi:hypothetical protein